MHGIQVTQHELEEIFELEREVAQKQKRIDELKSNVKALLFEKIPIEQGRFFARLNKRFSRHVPWKQAVIDNLGSEFANWFFHLYKPSIFFELLVEEHAVPPLWRGTTDTTGSEA
jgi:hypothetical protein